MMNRREEAEAVIMSLSNFYRTSLTGDPLDDVPLSDEVRLQQLYLDIEAIRFPDRLITRIDIPAELMSACVPGLIRSEEHTSELQSLMRISYAVFCLKKK